MSIRKLNVALLAASLIVSATVAQAHHAFSAEFDSSRPIDLVGVVTKARWVNPHSWLYFDVKEADGSVTNWGVEFGTPSSLTGKGLTKDDVKPGTEVHIKGYRSRNGGPSGYSVSLTLNDGRSFQIGTVQEAK